MSGRDHMSRVAALPCCVCALSGAEVFGVHVHHVKEGTGYGQRSSDWLVIPLCPDHHTGGLGIHGLGTHGFHGIYRSSELDLLAATLEKLYG